jgi:hypothetical protein
MKRFFNWIKLFIKHKLLNPQNNNSGAALAGVIMTSAALAVLAAAATKWVSKDIKYTENYVSSRQAFYIAEAGFQTAYHLLSYGFDGNYPGDVKDGFTEVLNSFISKRSKYLVDNQFGGGTYTVSVRDNDDNDNDLSTDADNVIIVSSTGIKDGESVTVEAYITNGSFRAKHAITTDNVLSITGDPTVDGSLGSIHANHDISGVSDNVEKGITASGDCLSPCVSDVARESLPAAEPEDFKPFANYILTSSGDITTTDGSEVDQAGLKNWRYVEDDGYSGWELEGCSGPGMFYSETDVRLVGDVGKCAPKTLDINADDFCFDLFMWDPFTDYVTGEKLEPNTEAYNKNYRRIRILDSNFFGLNMLLQRDIGSGFRSLQPRGAWGANSSNRWTREENLKRYMTSNGRGRAAFNYLSTCRKYVKHKKGIKVRANTNAIRIWKVVQEDLDAAAYFNFDTRLNFKSYCIVQQAMCNRNEVIASTRNRPDYRDGLSKNDTLDEIDIHGNTKNFRRYSTTNYEMETTCADINKLSCEIEPKGLLNTKGLAECSYELQFSNETKTIYQDCGEKVSLDELCNALYTPGRHYSSPPDFVNACKGRMKEDMYVKKRIQPYNDYHYERLKRFCSVRSKKHIGKNEHSFLTGYNRIYREMWYGSPDIPGGMCAYFNKDPQAMAYFKGNENSYDDEFGDTESEPSGGLFGKIDEEPLDLTLVSAGDILMTANANLKNFTNSAHAKAVQNILFLAGHDLKVSGTIPEPIKGITFGGEQIALDGSVSLEGYAIASDNNNENESVNYNSVSEDFKVTYNELRNPFKNDRVTVLSWKEK